MAGFVSLNLLRREVERVRQSFLVHAEEEAPHADALPDANIDRMENAGSPVVCGLFGGEFIAASGRLLYIRRVLTTYLVDI